MCDNRRIGIHLKGQVMSEDSLRYLSGRAQDQPVPVDKLAHKRVLLLLAEGFDDAEAACAVEMLGWTHYRPTCATVDVEVAAFREEALGAFGMRMRANVLVDEVEPASYDALVIPGGFHNLGYDEAYCESVRALVRAFVSGCKPIATMCVGIVPVAEAGVLAGGRAATYALSSRHDNPGRLRELGCEPSDEALVEWNGVISCSGPAYSEQVMALLLERLVGSQAASEVACYRDGRQIA